MLDSIAVEEVMSAPVRTIAPTATAAAAARAATAAGVGSLVVVDRDDPVGIVTVTDLVGVMAEGGDPADVTVGAAMSAPLVTVEPSATLAAAASRLRRHGIRRLPVVHGGGLVGIVTATDLANYLPTAARAGRARHPPGDRIEIAAAPELAYERDGWTTSYEPAGEEETVGVGDVVAFEKTLTARDVERFAEATGDTNRVHLDGQFAEGTRFGGRIAHGLLAAGWISAALARIPGVTIYLSQDLGFLAPVPVGSTVRAECTLEERLAADRFRLDTVVLADDGTPCIEGEAVVLIDALPP